MDIRTFFKKDRFFLIAGPCVIESREHALMMATALKDICQSRGIPFVFKSSFDKANRTSGDSPRGPGMEEGLKILSEIRKFLDVPVLTDVHETIQCEQVARHVDVLQIPAFLCRQTDLLIAAGKTGKIVNVKKGQFLAPWDLRHAVDKIRGTGMTEDVWVTERGSSFGYGNLVVDFQSFPALRQTGCPVIFDATHSVQKPGGLGHRSGGSRELIPTLARAAATAVDGFFFEVHNAPENAHSDGPNAMPLESFGSLLDELLPIWTASRQAALQDPLGKLN